MTSDAYFLSFYRTKVKLEYRLHGIRIRHSILYATGNDGKEEGRWKTVKKNNSNKGVVEKITRRHAIHEMICLFQMPRE